MSFTDMKTGITWHERSGQGLQRFLYLKMENRDKLAVFCQDVTRKSDL